MIEFLDPDVLGAGRLDGERQAPTVGRKGDAADASRRERPTRIHRGRHPVAGDPYGFQRRARARRAPWNEQQGPVGGERHVHRPHRRAHAVEHRDRRRRELERAQIERDGEDPSVGAPEDDAAVGHVPRLQDVLAELV